MKFAHMADCHIGGFREPKLNCLSLDAFEKAVSISIKERVDFVIIAGDLFNNPLPAIDKLKTTVTILKKLKDNNIPVYGIPGSHDFSPSGKTMIDVLEEADLFTNVCKGTIENNKLKLKFTVDKKTGTKLTGIIGKKGMLDKKIYESLELESLENEPGNKIFLFHTLLSELKTDKLEKMDSQALSLLPKGFNYYAGGHVHIVENKRFHKYGRVVYPGPLFPNSFSEIEDLKQGGFYIVEDNDEKFVQIELHPVVSINIDVHHKTSKEAEEMIIDSIENNLKNSIVTLRISGTLEIGRKSDIDFKKITDKLYENGAYFVMRNTNKLLNKEIEDIQIEAKSPEEIEEKLIEEHVGKIKIEEMNKETEKKLSKDLLQALSAAKMDGEKVSDYESRLIKDYLTVISENRLHKV